MNLRDRKTESVAEQYARHVNRTKVAMLAVVGLDIVPQRFEGCKVWDTEGKEYIDCITSSGVFNLGHRNPHIIKALTEALEHADVGLHLLVSKEKAELAAKLAQIAPGDLECSVFASGGGESNDFAVKLARGATGKTRILSMAGSYHGHTGFSLAASGNEYFKKPFEPLAPGFRTVPFNDVDAVRDAVDADTAAVIVEPIQGEGGVRVPDDDYLDGLRSVCDEHGLLLIFDEIQTGWARTGTMFCCQHYGVVPDIMTVGKSMGGGLYPIAATIFRPELNKLLLADPFIHMSTFGGADLGCCVALATIDYIEKNNLADRAARVGEGFADRLREIARQYPGTVTGIRQKGLMIGVELATARDGATMVKEMAARRVLASNSGSAPNVLRLMPPLTISPDETDRVLAAVAESVKAIARAT